MRKKTIDRGTILILDIGKNVSTLEESHEGKENNETYAKSFFESARECIIKIIEWKILSQEKNYLGIILLGSKKSKSIADKSLENFRHIEVISELQIPSWQMIRNLPKNTSNIVGNWFDSLTVATDRFCNGVEGVKFLNMKIILMTNFKSPSNVDSERIKMVMDGLKKNKIEMDVFGLDNGLDSDDKNPDLELAQHLVQTTGGESVSFDFCIEALTYHQKKLVRCNSWKVDLSFTPDVEIPVSCYIKLKDEPVVNWKKAVKNPATNTASATEGITKNKLHVNVENNNVSKSSDLIKGYHYGQDIIPISDKSMLKKSSKELLKVYGFTNADNITWHHLNGNNLLYVFGRTGDKKAQNTIKCLVLCLQEQNLVSIVRLVKGGAIKLCALMPIIDSDNDHCLSMADMCFKEDIKNMTFPPLNFKKYQCTVQQVDAFKDLIKEMDLMKAYHNLDHDDIVEAFPIAKTVSPGIQYVLDCVSFRALNPGKPLPEPRDDIMKLFRVPLPVENRSRNQLEKLKHLFVLKKIEPSTNIDSEIRELSNIDTNNLIKISESQNIGTVDPINDYEILISHGKTLCDITPLMTEAIESLIYTNIDGKYSKALESIRYFRNKCVVSEPSYYNNWLKSFKMELLERKTNDVLELIDSQKLDFIVKSENKSSNFKTAEQGNTQLYENDTVPTLTDMCISSQVKTFFDDM